MPFSEARGPTHARHLAATLYRNEDYFFQIDSHSTFRQACPRLQLPLMPAIYLAQYARRNYPSDPRNGMTRLCSIGVVAVLPVMTMRA